MERGIEAFVLIAAVMLFAVLVWGRFTHSDQLRHQRKAHKQEEGKRAVQIHDAHTFLGDAVIGICSGYYADLRDGHDRKTAAAEALDTWVRARSAVKKEVDLSAEDWAKVIIPHEKQIFL